MGSKADSCPSLSLSLLLERRHTLSLAPNRVTSSGTFYVVPGSDRAQRKWN
jgi:hypothetical protein